MAAAINHNNGTLLANSYATPPIANQSGVDSGLLQVKIATCAIPAVATDLANSVYTFCQVNSADIPSGLDFGATALTAGAISVGLFLSNSLTVAATNSDHLFATSINCASAVAPADKRFTNLSITTAGQRVWQLLGLASDPEAVYDLAAYSTTAATAAGTLYCKYQYTR
jgi:hypothetical protein